VPTAARGQEGFMKEIKHIKWKYSINTKHETYYHTLHSESTRNKLSTQKENGFTYTHGQKEQSFCKNSVYTLPFTYFLVG